MKRSSRLLLIPLVLCLVTPAISDAQGVGVGDPEWDHARMLELTPVDPWAASAQSRPAAALVGPGPRITATPLDLRFAFNSARPWGVNDGAIWQGRGATVAFSAGVMARWGAFSAALRPIVMRNQNRGFELSPLAVHPDLGPLSYPTRLGQTLDMPQRFGTEPFGTFDLGESYVRADVGPMAAGLSNESLWWGPARRNAISLTNNAPGFGHAFLGTSRPVGLGFGTLEARWHWGRLRESQYFDAREANDKRYFTGLTATLTPKGVPGLRLGVTRTFLSAWREGGPSLDEVLLIFVPLEKGKLASPSNPTGDDATDQMATLFARWVLPESGLELYGEWGRGDHSWDLRDLLVEPEHASAWMLGFQKAIDPEESRVWMLGAEITLIGGARTTLVRAPASAFYVHHIVTQGFTQRGQLMGAGIGPGSSQASVTLGRYAEWGRMGLALQRTVYDNNRFYAEPRPFDTHEVEPALLADVLLFRGRWDAGASIGLARLLNKGYVRHDDEWNANLNLALRYHLGAR